MSTKSSRKTLILTMTSVALVAALAAESASAKHRGHRGDLETRATKQFERLDVNEDGFLTLDELTTPALTKAENKFERRDADDDGFLTFEEATSGRRDPVDLSDIAEEIAQCVADLKEETGNEDIIVPDPDNYQSPQEKFDAADTSGDGVLDLAEVQAKAEEKATTKFENMDTNLDSQVSLEEFIAYKESRKATRRAVKACIEELTDEEG